MREFSSFGAFARHLGALAVEGEAVTHELTAKSAEMIARDAKAKLGEYQDRSGPFNAWDELAESTKDDRVNQGFPENEPLLRTGDLRDSIDTQVRGNEAVVGSDSLIALWQETGTERNGLPHIPPRPFLGAAAFESKRKIAALCGNTVIAWLCGLGWRRPQERVVNSSSFD